ncbi:MAG: hypothetical protein LBV00_02760 [Propionibacteriaceae bacterium]|nr:hypothetical protein [Propionibacteriaceae bacterium]
MIAAVVTAIAGTGLIVWVTRKKRRHITE